MKKIIALIFILVVLAVGISTGIVKKTNSKYDNTDESREIKKDSKIEESKEEITIPALDEEKEEIKEENIIETKEEKVKEEKKETVKKVEKSETKKEETSKKEETKEEPIKTETVVTKEIISEETEREESSEPFKYGIILIENKTYKVITYNTAEVEKKIIKTSKKYDKTNYSASTDDLKEEAKSVLNKNKSIYQNVVNNVNTYRKEVEVNDIILDDDLSLAATIRAMEMGYSAKEKLDISHTRPNGTAYFTVLQELNIPNSISGENIAAGYGNADSVSKGWRDSSGHYANMINSDFRKIGVGMFEFSGTKYWVQLFSN